MPKRSKNLGILSANCAGGSVYLRAPKWADFEAWVNLRRENRAHLTPWEPSWNEKSFTRYAYRSKLAKFKSLISQDRVYPYYVFRREDHQLLGACNLTGVKRGSMQSAEIGYWIGEAYSRQGFARAAVGAVLRFAFEDIGLHRIVAAVREDNVASINLLQQMGFVSEGVARGYLKIDGKWQDHLIYARLREDI
ncbi:MAG TPA: N-acetyltransferase [Hellea balneolensis]|uniref:N-acetyltransferase n=1 Tax=Hellea balneolensis TaxID=287478 RepID=A0A7C5LTU1_9PROT|nr:N-acetyltransferase [Hellea balneolensis]